LIPNNLYISLSCHFWPGSQADMGTMDPYLSLCACFNLL